MLFRSPVLAVPCWRVYEVNRQMPIRNACSCRFINLIVPSTLVPQINRFPIGIIPRRKISSVWSIIELILKCESEAAPSARNVIAGMGDKLFCAVRVSRQ